MFAYVLPNRRANSDEWDGEVVFGVDEAGRWFAQRWRIRRPQRGSWGRVFEEMINRPLGQMPREGLFGGFYERSGRVLERSRTPTG